MKIRRYILPCAVGLAAAGCVWPLAVEKRTLVYDGRVTRADGSPVGGVEVEITDGFDVVRPGAPPRPDGVPECGGTIEGAVVRANTGPDGGYRVEVLRESSAVGACIRVRVAPPAGSSLAEHVVQSESSRYIQPDTNDSLLHRRVDVTVPWPR
jgi:hypothetical protein